MDQSEVYQWRDSIGERLGLGHWQAQMLAGLSLGIVAGRSCTLSTVAEHLGCLGKADSVERRIQRWLNKPHIQRERVQMAWVRWVTQSVGLGQERLIVLVDETKVGEHLNSMMVGLAYRQRCIGFTLRCYQPGAWPEGHIALIERLTKRRAADLPSGGDVLDAAQRGPGAG